MPHQYKNRSLTSLIDLHECDQEHRHTDPVFITDLLNGENEVTRLDKECQWDTMKEYQAKYSTTSKAVQNRQCEKMNEQHYKDKCKVNTMREETHN